MLSRKIPKLRLDLNSKGKSRLDKHKLGFVEYLFSGGSEVTTVQSKEAKEGETCLSFKADARLRTIVPNAAREARNDGTERRVPEKSIFTKPLHSYFGYLLQGIPVLSIFALFGLMIYAAIGDFYVSKCAAGCGQNSCPPGYALDEFYCCEKLQSYPSPDATASITLGGAGSTEVVPAGRGEVTYREHTVRITATNAQSYSLTLSGDSDLTLANGSERLTGVTNTFGQNIPSNYWGYGWGDTTVASASLTYNAPSSTPVTLASGNTTNYAVDFSKKLAFAARFGEDIAAGNYRANVTLSLAVTPATVTSYSLTYNANGGTGTGPSVQTADSIEASYSFTAAGQGSLTKSGYKFLGWSESSTATVATYAAGANVTLAQASPSKVLYAVWKKAPSVSGFGGITSMQEMTPSVCKNASGSGALYDERDETVYSVQKVNSSGQCWMSEPLRLTKESLVNKGHSPILRVSDNDTDMAAGTANFELPASGEVHYPDANTAAVYYNSSYGAYYSWNAATAGVGTTALSSGDAASSICPKGWYLPKGGLGTTNDFAKAMRYTSSLSDANTEIASSISAYASGNYIVANGISWGIWGSADGFYYIVNNGTHGRYWSRTAEGSERVYALIMPTPYIYPAQPVKRANNGYLMRCVAYSS